MSGVCDMLEVYVRGMRYVGGICQGYVICWRYMSGVCDIWRYMSGVCDIWRYMSGICDMLEVYVRGM